MPGQHALLSPSSAHRWLNCPPSAKLCAAQEEATSVYAQQGTDAHELCQYKLEKALGLDTKDPTEDLTYYDAEMEDCACDYASFVMETLAHIKETSANAVVPVRPIITAQESIAAKSLFFILSSAFHLFLCFGSM